MTSTPAPVVVWFCRHAEIPSHRGDLSITEAGAGRARAAGETLARRCPDGARVDFLHAPTKRTLETAAAVRAGMAAAAPGLRLGAPRVELAIRNPDLYVAGHRVEMVSSAAALAAQLPSRSLDEDQLAAHGFFARFWAVPDRLGVWMRDPDPPGERPEDVARRFFTFARSLVDATGEAPRCVVCVTHSGPLRAIIERFLLGRDPGEPGYVEDVELVLEADGPATWRYRDVTRRAAPLTG